MSIIGFNVSIKYGMPITCKNKINVINLSHEVFMSLNLQDYTYTFMNSSTVFVAKEFPRNNVLRVSINSKQKCFLRYFKENRDKNIFIIHTEDLKKRYILHTSINNLNLC